MKPLKISGLSKPKTKKKSKYRNVKVVVCGINFDSKKESERYLYLRSLELAGKIKKLKLQQRFSLLPSQYIDNKLIERPTAYVADFVYQQDGKIIVEDTKGVKTEGYVIKRKLMLWFHGIKINEV